MPSQIRQLSVNFLFGKDGSNRLVYVSLSDAKVAKTKSLIDAEVLADFDAEGNLIGVDILGGDDDAT